MKNLKLRVFEIVQVSTEGDLVSKIFDRTIIGLILLNVCFAVIDTFHTPSWCQTVMNLTNIISTVIFTVEYGIRLWTSDYLYPELPPFLSRIRYAFSFMAFVDLLAILPFYIPIVIHVDLKILRVLRVIRMFSILKFNRYSNAVSQITNVFKRKSGQLLSSMFIVTLLMVVASIIMYDVENTAQPDKFRNALSGLWWAVSTLTTVGYGDIYPITSLGKVVSAVIALLGIGLIAVPTGIISAGFMEEIESAKQLHDVLECEEEMHYCPYCGKRLH